MTNPLEKAQKLDNWAPLDIHRWSDYPEVNKTVDALYDQMTRLKAFSGKSNIRKKHIKVIILDLYVRYLENPDRYTGFYRMEAMYRKNKRYNRLHITKTTILVADALLDLGLIEHHIGYYVREGKGSSHMSRMRAKPELISLIEEHGWNEAMVDKAPDTECIILRDYDADKDRKVDVDYTDTTETERMRKNVCRYNNLLRRTFIDIPEFPEEGILPEIGEKVITLNRANKFVRRIFNNESWDDGGRFYGPWWQNVPKKWRDKIRIEDEQTIEWDYSGLHIILLYALEGLDYWSIDGKDPYWLEGYEQTEALRGLLKIVLLISINAKNLEKAVAGVRHHANKDIERFRWIYDEEVDLPRVIEDFSNRHQPIKQSFFSGIGVELQNIDAQIAETVIEELSLNQVPVLSIHDSFVVTRQNEEYLEDIMERAIKEVCQRVVGTEVSNKAKRNIEEGFLMPWKRLKTFEFEREGTPEKISDYWEEQMVWVRGLEEGKFPKYARRLKLHRSIDWSKDYFTA
jgi:hypothetical protein